MIRTDLGPVTAYAIAVSRGEFTGTEQEFAALLSNSAVNAQTASTKAGEAASSATAAANSATAAASSATAAQSAASTAAADVLANVVDNTLSVSGKAADAKKTGDEITGLKTDFTLLTDSGTVRFNADDFYNRGLDNSGNFNSQTYRVSSKNIVTANNNVLLRVQSGFRFYVYYFDENDNVTSLVGWNTTSYTIPSGNRYKILIARVTENTSETANISEFVNAIIVGSYISGLSDKIDDLKVNALLTSWTAENVFSDRKNLTPEFAQTSNQAFVITNGYVSTASTTNYKWRTGSIVEGHKYYIKSTVGNTAYGYAFTDADNKVLASDAVHTTSESFAVDVIAPEGATKLFVNALTSYSSEIYENSVLHYKYALPHYYDSHLETKIGAIHDLEMDAGHGSATYAFITDMHYPANKLMSIPLLERIKERTNAEHLFYGGDSVRALGAEAYLKSDNYNIAKLLYSVYESDYSYIFGNHDYTIATGGSWGQNMVSISTASVKTVYKKGYDIPIDRVYHYWDDEINKIRHIFVDYTSAGLPWFLTWFRDTALNVQSGWGICVYAHTPFVDVSGYEGATQYMKYLADWICAFANHTTYTATITSTAGGQTFVQEIDVDYTNSNAYVPYVACGHIHADTATAKDGVMFFSTTCDAMYQDDGYGRSAGTISENAFDVIHIDKTNRKVNLVRIGAGSDRNWTY